MASNREYVSEGCVAEALGNPSTFEKWVEEQSTSGRTVFGTTKNPHNCPLFHFVHDVCPGVTNVRIGTGAVTYKDPTSNLYKFLELPMWGRLFVRAIDGTGSWHAVVEDVKESLAYARKDAETEVNDVSAE